LELSNLDDHFRRIDEKVRRLGYPRLDLVQTWDHLTDATVPAHEREEDERKAKQQEAKKKFGGMIDEKSASGIRASFRRGSKAKTRNTITGSEPELAAIDDGPPRSPTLAASGEKPSDKELQTHFSASILSEEEQDLRSMARKLKISLDNATKIREYFIRYDTDKSGAISIEEFRHVVEDVFLTGKAKHCTMPDKVVDQYFIAANRSGASEISMEDFLVWAHKENIIDKAAGRFDEAEGEQTAQMLMQKARPDLYGKAKKKQ
jgi:Ca2+-binding EF-hand superfamily protein